MSKQRKQYTLEFKREAVQLWENSGKAASEIEKDLGITPGLLYRWKSRLQKKAQAEANGYRSPADLENSLSYQFVH